MNPIKQAYKQNKIKTFKHLGFRTKDAENKDIAKCIVQIIESRSITPFITSLVLKFTNKKDYTDRYLQRRRTEIGKIISKEGKAIEIHTIAIKKKQKKFSGILKDIPQKWFNILIDVETMLLWYALEDKEVLDKLLDRRLLAKRDKKIFEEAGGAINLKIIAKMFRNRFFVFYDNDKSWDKSNEAQFMRRCTKRIEQVMSHINKLKKNDNNKTDGNRKINEFLEYERKVKAEEQTKSINDLKSLRQFIDNEYEKIIRMNESLSTAPKFPSYEELERTYKEKMCVIGINKNSNHLKKIQQVVLNKIKELLQSVIAKKARYYKWKSLKSKDSPWFFKSRLDKNVLKTKFEIIKQDLNVKKLAILAKFCNKKGVFWKEKHLSFKINTDGKEKDVFITRDFTANKLCTSDDYRRYTWKQLQMIFKKYRALYFEFADYIGVYGLKQYKKHNSSYIFDKSVWFNIIKKVFVKLMYRGCNKIL